MRQQINLRLTRRKTRLPLILFNSRVGRPRAHHSLLR